ncbi:MAG: hypothetical protein EA447_03375 [Nitrosopumilus sp.]|nr:MAG: hypothetical protein EA447_03375 [Nitrosopumilus sp.]
MDILMAIVIGFILVVAGYVGYYASQEEPKAGGHDISLELEVLNTESKTIQSFNQVMTKSTS